MILSFSDSSHEAQALADLLGLPHHTIHTRYFPDGESLVRLPPELPESVVIFRSLHHPDSKLVQLLIAVRTARQLGARHLTLITPYLCYMRQDMAFEPGQAVSQLIIGQWLGELFDAVITVDPHLHRIDRLEQAIPIKEAITLSAAESIGHYLKDHRLSDAVLIGPDAESHQWVSEVSRVCGAPFVTASKVRSGDTSVAVTLPPFDYRDKHLILVDDVISSGHTMIEAAREGLKRGARKVSAVCTHALLAENARELMSDAGIVDVLSCNSIADDSNRIDLTSLLGASYRELISRQHAD